MTDHETADGATPLTEETLLVRRAAFLDKIDADIARVGWTAIGVFPTRDDPLPHGFTYTVGLTETHGHPELIICGLSMEQSHDLLACAIEMIEAGQPTRLHAGERYAKVLAEPYTVEVREVPKPVHPLNFAIRRYGDSVSALQLVWPDAEGRFPGEPGMNEKFAAAQVLVQS